MDTYIETLCKKVGKNLRDLARVIYKVHVYKRSTNVNEKLMSQFSYYPLIWMCHSRKINNQIYRLHERALRLAYNNKTSSFRELLEKDKSVTIHERNIQVLLTEIPFSNSKSNSNTIYMIRGITA